MSPLPQFMLCRKSSGTAHLGGQGAARGLRESATHRKIQWVTKQGLEIQQSWAVDPQGPGYAETRGQPTLKMSQWFTKTHGCILRNRGGYTAAAGDVHGAQVSRSTDSTTHRGHLDTHRYMSTHIHIRARCTHTHILLTSYVTRALCPTFPSLDFILCHGGSMVVIHEDRESAACLCPSDTSV